MSQVEAKAGYKEPIQTQPEGARPFKAPIVAVPEAVNLRREAELARAGIVEVVAAPVVEEAPAPAPVVETPAPVVEVPAVEETPAPAEVPAEEAAVEEQAAAAEETSGEEAAE